MQGGLFSAKPLYPLKQHVCDPGPPSSLIREDDMEDFFGFDSTLQCLLRVG